MAGITFLAMLGALGMYGYLGLVSEASRLGDSVSGDGELVNGHITSIGGSMAPYLDYRRSQ